MKTDVPHIDGDAKPKRRGRPTLPPDQRLSEYFPMWVSLAQRAKIERLGGPEAVRRLIDLAKEPPKNGFPDAG